MLTEEFSLDFVGFEPDDDLLHMIRIRMSDLYAKSPHRSFLKATFTKTGHAFEGIIDITSGVVKFAVQVQNPDINTLSSQAFDKIKWDLDSWKAKRFI